MKRHLILITIFCFCFSLAAAEGEEEQNKKKQPSWTTKNLFYGPMMLVCSPIAFVPSLLFMGLAGPLVVPVVAIDGAIHTATFGVFARPEKDPLENLLILRLLFDFSSEKEIFEKGVAKYQKKAEKGNARSIANLSDVYYRYYKLKWNDTYVEKRVGTDQQKYEQEKQEYLKIKSETLKWLDKAVKAGEEKALSTDDYKTAKERYDLIMNTPDPWDAKDNETPFMELFRIHEDGTASWSPK